MRKITLLTIVLLITKIVLAQNYDSLFNPQIARELKSKNIIAEIRNYDRLIGKYFGEFSGKDITNKNISNKNLMGKISFVNFWFISCSPCHLEFPAINNIYNKYYQDSNFQIITFTFDGVEDARRTSEKYKLLYKIVHLPNEVCSKLIFGKGYPCNFILDETGKIVFAQSAFSENGEMILEKEFTPKIDSLLMDLKSKKFKKQ
jgi:peroxiredoxin